MARNSLKFMIKKFFIVELVVQTVGLVFDIMYHLNIGIEIPKGLLTLDH